MAPAPAPAAALALVSVEVDSALWGPPLAAFVEFPDHVHNIVASGDAGNRVVEAPVLALLSCVADAVPRPDAAVDVVAYAVVDDLAFADAVLASSPWKE